MSFQDRVLLVTNDDSSIAYVDEWTTVQASTVNNLGNNGPAFSSTLHSTTTMSSFIFPFHGSSIEIFGTVNITNPSTNPNPTWQCVLDGISLGAPNIFNSFENNWSLCSQQNIPDGAHELVVNVTSKGMPFYLDYIQYRPSSNASLENSLIVINNVDPAIDYISGWSVGVEKTANQTADPQGLVNVTFVGIELSWYGLTLIEESHDASSGEYSIDGQPYTSFQLPGLPQSFSATAFNQLFFTTPTLEMGTHVLSAKYTGSSGQTPFTLDYLHVTNGSFPPTSSPPTSSTNGVRGNLTTHTAPPTRTNPAGSVGGNTSNPDPADDNSKSSLHIGIIVGCVVGAIGVIVISVIVFSWLKRKLRRSDLYNRVIRHRTIDPFSIQPPQFVSQAVAPPLTSSEFSQIHGKQYTHPPSQPDTSQASNPVSSSNGSISYNRDETSSGSRYSRLLAASSAQFILPRPLRNDLAPVAETATGAAIQHEDSGIRLTQPLREPVVEIPPAYSEQ